VFVCDFASALDKDPKGRDYSVDEFEAVCRTYAAAPLVRHRVENAVRDNPPMAETAWNEVKKEGACFSPVKYRDGTQRKKVNVESVTAYVVDLDGIPSDFVAALFAGLEADNVRHWAWTTWGHGWKTEGECWRVVIPFADPVAVEPGLWPAVWSRINESFCGGMNDRSTHDEGRLHFYPRAPFVVGDANGWRHNTPPQWRSFAGEMLNPSVFVEDARASIEANRRELALKANTRREARTSEGHVEHWGRATLDGIVARLAKAQDGEKHHLLRNMSWCAGGLTPHAVSVDEARQALRGAVKSWQAAGLKVKSITAAEKLIESGLRKGAASPMHPDPVRVYDDDRPIMSDEEVDEMMRAAGVTFDDDPPVLRVIHGEGKRETQDERAERLWASFAALPSIPAAYAADLEKRVDYRQPGIMLASGLALCAALTMRRLAFDGLTTTSIYCVVAPTASGKGAPQAFVEEALRAGGWPDIVGPGDFSTTASFLDRIGSATLLDHGLLYVVDEYGPQLKLMMNEKNIAQGALRPTLLRLSTCNTSTVTFATPRSGGGADRQMQAPGLCLYTSTTPEALHDAIGPMAARDGFLGRHLWFGAASVLPHYNRMQKREPPSQALIAGVAERRRRWAAWKDTLSPLTGQTGPAGEPLSFYRPDEVKADDDARAHLEAFRERKDEARRREKSDNLEGLLGRQTEHAKRIAMALADATCDGPAYPQIGLAHVELACEVAEYSADVIGGSMTMHAGGDKWEQQVGKVRRAMARVIGAGTNPTKRDLMRAANMKRADLDEVLIFLRDTDQLGANTAHLAPKEAQKAKKDEQA
jgi:hypothetical protein